MNYIGKVSLMKYLDKFHQRIIDNLHLYAVESYWWTSGRVKVISQQDSMSVNLICLALRIYHNLLQVMMIGQQDSFLTYL